MRLSRKPRNLVIMMLMAVMLLTFAGLAGAAPTVNWGFDSGASRSSVTGSVYDTSDQVYATVYANIYGTLEATSIVNQYIYSSTPISFNAISLKGRSLTEGQTYPVGLVVYTSATTPVDLASATVTTANTTFKYYVPATGGDTGGDTGGTTGGTTGTSSGSATTAPSITANLGQAVSITASKGAEVAAPGVTIAIPAGALTGNAKVTVTQVANVTGLTVPAASQLISQVLEITKDVAGDFSKPITLTLDFDKTKVDLNKFDVKVCFFDEKNKTWVPLDGIKVEGDKVSGNVTHFTKFAVLTYPKADASTTTTVSGLNDITGHWAQANIQKLVDLKAISGYPDGTFKPNNTVTRAEFATVLAKAFKLDAKGGKVFADTQNHWAKDYIAAVAAAGIVSGYSDAKFGPDDLITREQMAVMMAKAAKLAAAEGKTFSDSAAIAAWAKDAVASVTAAGVMGGYPDGSFGPKGNATRAEMATVIIKAAK